MIHWHQNAPMDQQWMGGALALAGVAVTWVGGQINETFARRRARKAERKEHAVALLTACFDTGHAVLVLRGMMPTGHRRSLYFRGLAEFWAAGDKPLLERLAAGSRPALEAGDPRRIVSDYLQILSPHLHSLGEAAVRVSLLGDKTLQDAATKLTDAIGKLVGAIDDRESAFSELEARVTTAVEEFREAIGPGPRRRLLKRRNRPHQIAG